MNLRNVTIIPPTNSNQPNRYLGTPRKIHVVGYARVIKGTGAGVQIRKNIRQLSADKSEWELTFVKTDYRQAENQDLTWHSFITICKEIQKFCQLNHRVTFTMFKKIDSNRKMIILYTNI